MTKIYKENEFSVCYPPINKTEIDDKGNLKEIYDLITSDDIAETTEKYRAQKGDKGKMFPYALFSGEFSKRRDSALIRHSNLLAVDIDKLENIQLTIKTLSKDKHIGLLYTTPSANGLRAILKIDINKASHLDYFSSIEGYFKDKHDITIDPSCKNVSRASYLCHDPNAYYNSSFNTYVIESNTDLDPKINPINNSTIVKLESCIEQMQLKGTDITNDYEKWLNIGFALANELEEEGREYFHQISEFHSEYSEDESDKQYSACLNSKKEGITIATFFHYCKEVGIEYKPPYPPKKTKLNTSIKSIVTANERLNIAKSLPPIKRLFGEFWATNQICIFFGDTGVGKSILTVQLADKISKGESLFELKNENLPLKVLLYDFELSDKQFEKRYSDQNGNTFDFSNNFLFKRFDIEEFYSHKDKHPKICFEEWLFYRIESDIEITNAEVLIIDNITFLNTHTSQDAQVAEDLMRRLKHLKDNLGISILVIAHTPKIPRNEPLIKNHLAGSKQLSNFSDSIFCIGKSGLGHDWCYLKQIKARDGIEFFDEDNVLSIWKEKQNTMLKFVFESYTAEEVHFSRKKDRESMKVIATELYKKHNSYRKVAEKIGVSHQQVKRLIDEAENEK